MKNILNIITLSILILAPLRLSYAEAPAGHVTTVKNKASILRSGKTLEAKAKDDIFKPDTVETYKGARLKLLFSDDSLLTLGENSRLIVKEYLEAPKDKRGQSIYNLIDGKMRAIVGKTDLEVHTPTAVAAARGTHFIVSLFRISERYSGVLMQQGRVQLDSDWNEQLHIEGPGVLVSAILVIEGTVEVRNIKDDIKGKSLVHPKQIIFVINGEPPAGPFDAPDGLFKLLLDQTSLDDDLAVLPPEFYMPVTNVPLIPPVNDMERKSEINININVR